MTVLLGILVVAVILIVAAYGLWRGRDVPASGSRHEDWFRTRLGNPRLPGDRDFKDPDNTSG